jgi:GTP-binding protein
MKQFYQGINTRMSLFSKIHFLTTVNELRMLPRMGLEVAFAGRSNAGKSSAINTLANQTRLAYVSKTPGRTQHINYFALDEQNRRHIVDLPGYGYAEVPEAIRKHWEHLLGKYLQTRDNLIGLVIMMDSRHPLKPLDRQMLNWFFPTGKPVHILLTKADKLSKNEAKHTLAWVKEEVANADCTVQLFSSLKKQGVAEAEARLEEWFIAAEQQTDLDRGENAILA